MVHVARTISVSYRFHLYQLDGYNNTSQNTRPIQLMHGIRVFSRKENDP